MSHEREKLHAQALADELSQYAGKSVTIKLANTVAEGDTDSGNTAGEVELIVDASVFGQINEEDRALSVWRGIGYRALARSKRDAAIEAKFSEAGEKVTELYRLLEDAQRLANTRKQDPIIHRCLAALALFESKQDTQLTGYPALFSKFRYVFMSGVPLQGVPVRVTTALEKAKASAAEFSNLDSPRLLDLAEQIYECLEPRPVVVPQPTAQLPQGGRGQITVPAGMQNLPQFASADDGANWVQQHATSYLDGGTYGVTEKDSRFGQLQMLQACLKTDCLEALPLRVQEGDLAKIMEIAQMVFFVCREIDTLLGQGQT